MNHETPDCRTCSTRKLSPFGLCNKDQVLDVQLAKTCNFYKKGQFIFSENSLPIGLFCVSSGTIKLVKYGSGGKEQILRIAKPGDFVGFRSLITRRRYNASAVAASDASVCLLPRKDFQHLLETNLEFSIEIMQKVCALAEETENKLTDIAYKPARGRIADALLLLSNAENSRDGVQLSREELASFTGTVKETTIRILSEFKKNELIAINKRRIEILNPQGLEQMSNQFD